MQLSCDYKAITAVISLPTNNPNRPLRRQRPLRRFRRQRSFGRQQASQYVVHAHDAEAFELEFPDDGAQQTVVTEGALIGRAHAALRAKYGWQVRLLDLVSTLTGRAKRRAWLEVTP